MVYWKGNKPKLTELQSTLGYSYLWCGTSEGWILIDKFGGTIACY